MVGIFLGGLKIDYVCGEVLGTRKLFAGIDSIVEFSELMILFPLFGKLH